jgi:hypothetical protein
LESLAVVPLPLRFPPSIPSRYQACCKRITYLTYPEEKNRLPQTHRAADREGWRVVTYYVFNSKLCIIYKGKQLTFLYFCLGFERINPKCVYLKPSLDLSPKPSARSKPICVNQIKLSGQRKVMPSQFPMRRQACRANRVQLGRQGSAPACIARRVRMHTVFE